MTALAPLRPRTGALADRRRWLELGVLAAILLIAVLARLPGIDARGQWDSDQGHDMRVLAALVGQGQIPLLGPVTSVGTFHHGALYYYLLAPSAFLSGSNPVGVTVEFALLGIAAVGATWWLARLVAGPVASAVAGGLLALSPAGISESTFIWNPNPIPLFAALAAIGVIKARRSGRLRWWALAAFATMMTMQLHWLGGVVVVPLAAAWLLELRRTGRDRAASSVLRRAGLLGILILALGYVPLAIHEATHDASEIRAVLAYLTAGGGQAQAGIADRVLMAAWRSLTWPVAGLVTDRPVMSLTALLLVLALGGIATAAAWRRRQAPNESVTTAGLTDLPDVWALRWLVGGLGFAVLALAVLAPSLAVVVPGLPNDHYHAFLDPVVLTLVGAGVAVLARAPRGVAGGARLAGPASGIVLTAGLAVIAVTAWPPAVAPDGGWRLADAAAAHVIEIVVPGWPASEPKLLVGLPTFKPDDAMRFPLERRGLPLEPPVPFPASAGGLDVGVVTIVCDPLFDDMTGAPCGGPAEERWMADAYPPGTMDLAERFSAGDRRVISIYGPSRLTLNVHRAP